MLSCFFSNFQRSVYKFREKKASDGFSVCEDSMTARTEGWNSQIKSHLSFSSLAAEIVSSTPIKLKLVIELQALEIQSTFDPYTKPMLAPFDHVLSIF
jgi:hypothetical protein